MTRILPADRPGAIEQALALLKAGELVAFPTDTVYGLGADAFNVQAIERLYQVKEREITKAIAILIGEQAHLQQVIAEMTPLAARLSERFWPGPLTLVVPSHPRLPPNLSPLPTIGVRMPNHPIALELLRRSGPLAVTSANLSGAPSTVTAEEVYAQLQGRLPIILDGGRTPGGVPSTVVDCTVTPPTILRQGPITEEMLKQAWEEA